MRNERETETFIRTEDLYSGPRRKAVEKLDREIHVFTEMLNLGIDNEDWELAYEAVQSLKALQAERHETIHTSIHNIPGAVEELTQSRLKDDENSESNPV